MPFKHTQATEAATTGVLGEDWGPVKRAVVTAAPIFPCGSTLRLSRNDVDTENVDPNANDTANTTSSGAAEEKGNGNDTDPEEAGPASLTESTTAQSTYDSEGGLRLEAPESPKTLAEALRIKKNKKALIDDFGEEVFELIVEGKRDAINRRVVKAFADAQKLGAAPLVKKVKEVLINAQNLGAQMIAVNRVLDDAHSTSKPPPKEKAPTNMAEFNRIFVC